MFYMFFFLKWSSASLLTLKVNYSDLCPILSTSSYKKYNFYKQYSKIYRQHMRNMCNLTLLFTFSPSKYFLHARLVVGTYKWEWVLIISYKGKKMLTAWKNILVYLLGLCSCMLSCKTRAWAEFDSRNQLSSFSGKGCNSCWLVPYLIFWPLLFYCFLNDLQQPVFVSGAWKLFLDSWKALRSCLVL